MCSFVRCTWGFVEYIRNRAVSEGTLNVEMTTILLLSSLFSTVFSFLYFRHFAAYPTHSHTHTDARTQPVLNSLFFRLYGIFRVFGRNECNNSSQKRWVLRAQFSCCMRFFVLSSVFFETKIEKKEKEKK